MDCFDCIFISAEDLAYFTLIFSPWFHYFSISCSTCTKSTNSMKSSGNISTEWAGKYYWKKYYFIHNVFLFLQPFRKCFSNFRSNSRNNATVCESPMLKKYFNSRKKYFLVWHFIENQVFKISTLFPCFSVFS